MSDGSLDSSGLKPRQKKWFTLFSYTVRVRAPQKWTDKKAQQRLQEVEAAFDDALADLQEQLWRIDRELELEDEE